MGLASASCSRSNPAFEARLGTGDAAAPGGGEGDGSRGGGGPERAPTASPLADAGSRPPDVAALPDVATPPDTGAPPDGVTPVDIATPPPPDAAPPPPDAAPPPRDVAPPPPDVAPPPPDAPPPPPDLAPPPPDLAPPPPDLPPDTGPGVCSPWWVPVYAESFPLALDPPAYSVEAGWWSSVTIDHRALVLAGRARADGADLRIVRQAGAAYDERPRFLADGSAWNQPTTTLWFQLASPIAAGAADASYALFLGNPAGAAPPEPAPITIFDGVIAGSTVNGVQGFQRVDTGAYDPARSFIVFQTRHDSGRPVASMLQARLQASGQIWFFRQTDELVPAPMAITYFVVKAANGVAVQRPQANLAITPADVAIAPVSDTARAFLLWSKSPDPGSATWSTNDPIWATLTARNNLRVHMVEQFVGHEATVEVVDLPHAAGTTVQRGETSLRNGALSVEVVLPRPVDPSRSFVLVGFTTAGAGNDLGARMISAELVAGASVRINRALPGDADDLPSINWQVVELPVGARVQSGMTTLATGARTGRVTLPRAVTPARSFAMATVQVGGGQNMGATDFAADDIIGACSATFALDGQGVTLTRENAAATCTMGWQVVELPGRGSATAAATPIPRPALPCP